MATEETQAIQTRLAETEDIIHALLRGEVDAAVASRQLLLRLREAEQARREGEREARRRADEIEAIYNSAGAGLCVFDAELRFVRINERMAELNGVPAAEHVGRTPREVVPDLADQAEALLTRIVETGEPIRDVEFTGTTPAQPGVERTWIAQWTPLKDESGRVLGVNVVAEEITRHKQAEEALRKAKDELETRVRERTAELRQTNERLQRKNQERIRTEQSLRLEEARLDALLHLSRITEAPLDEITGFALKQAIALTHSRIGFLGFLDEDETVYTLHSVSRDVVKECGVADNPMQWPVSDAGIWADAIRERKTLFVNDLSQPHSRKKGFPPGHLPVEKLLVVPVFEGERIVAVAGVANKASDYNKSDERQLLLLLSGMWACVQRRRSREELQKAYDALEEKVARRTAELAASTAALEESQKDLTHAQAVGQIGSWRLDVRRNVLMWSDENHRIFGIPQGTPLTYETFLAAVHPDDRQYVDAKWNAALRGQPYDIEHRIVVDGAVRWVREKAYLESDGAGRLRGGFGITQDITDRKQAEAALQGLNESLEEQVVERTAVAERRARDLRRLASELSEAEHRERKRLAGLLHDDLQQLLLAVKLRLPLLADADADQLRRHVERLDELVGACLSTSRNLTQELSPPIIQYGTLADVVEWLGEWFAEKHGLTVAAEARDEIPPAPEHLRVFLFQAVRELLLNVVKHSRTTEARVCLSFQDACLRLQVEDGGKGFDPHAVEARLQRPEGFGLFNIRERLEALRGRLEIAATPGGGACFRLIVPMAERAESPGATAGLSSRASHIDTAETMGRRTSEQSHPTRRPRARGGVVRLLVVDDHAVVRQGFVGLLDGQAEFEVVGEAADGEQAVEQAEALQPDVILMDVDMPRVDGIEATRRIKQRQPEIVIVGLSLHEDERVALAMAEAGADGYLSKHAAVRDLVEAVRQVCR
jgi:PAS domain S-box-containing protein